MNKYYIKCTRKYSKRLNLQENTHDVDGEWVSIPLHTQGLVNSSTQMFFSKPSCLILKRDCLILVSSKFGICSSTKMTPYHTVVSGWEKLNLVRVGHLVAFKQIRATTVSYLILKFLSFKSAKGKINASRIKVRNFLLKDTFLLAAILPPALLSFEGGIKAGSYHFNETFSF